MFPLLTEAKPGYYHLTIHAKPGARSSTFAMPLTSTDGAVELRIAAPPVEGQANKELVDFLQGVVERGLSALRSDRETFLQDTSYDRLMAMAQSASVLSIKAQQGAKSDSEVGDRTGKKSKAGKQQKKVSSPSKSRVAEAGSFLPSRVSVDLVRGGMSRDKVVLVEFPGTREELIALLEKESRE